MNRFRVASGLLIAVVGTAWWAGALPAAAAAALAAAPYLLLLWGLAAAAQTIAPRGRLTGPAVVTVAGAAWLAVRADVLGPELLGQLVPALVIAGGCAVAITGGRNGPPNFGVRRFRSFYREQRFGLTGRVPSKVSLLSILFPATLDVAGTSHASNEKILMEIDVTVLAGRVEIVLPAHWSAVAGRFLTAGVRFDGELDEAAPVTAAGDLDVRRPTAVVNVQGLGGWVILRKLRASPPA